MSSLQKFSLLTCLYFSQGLPYGFFTQVLPVFMREDQATLPQIGLTSLLALPWMLKFLWAPFVDSYGHGGLGRRRGWILGLQGCAIVLFAVMALCGTRSGLMPLIVAYLLANLIAATQDIATDGLAVDLLEPAERGVGNGLQVAGYRLGMIMGGGAVLVILDHTSRSVAFWAMSLALLLAVWPAWSFREPARLLPPRNRPTLTLLSDFVRRPGMPLWLVMIGFYKFGDAMTTQMLRPFLVDLDWSKTTIGGFNSLGSAGGLIGALIGGYLVRAWGRYAAVVGLGVLQTAGVAAYYLVCRGWLPEAWLYPVGFVEHLTGGMATAALFTAMMDACRPDSGATDYTIQASVVVMTTGAAHALSGFIAEDIGYMGTFVVSAALCFLGAAAFAVIYRGRSAADGTVQTAPAPRLAPAE